jgi:homoserine dehydrogenase
MVEQSFGITLLGCGTVGAGVAQILTRQRELLARRTGLSFDLRHVFVRNPANPPAGAKGLPGLPLTADAQKAIDDPKTQVVVELLGGTTVAYELVKRAL